MNENLNKKTEEIFDQVGHFGPYQLLIFILVGIIASVPSFVGFSYSFYGTVPNHRLKIITVLTFFTILLLDARFLHIQMTHMKFKTHTMNN